MSDKNKNAAAEAVAVLQLDYDTKLGLFNGLDQSATDEVKADAQTAVDEAKVLLDAELEKATVTTAKAGPVKAEKTKLVKGKFLLSPTGRFGLAYNVGEPAELPELQAVELEEAGYFKINSK